MITTSGAVKVAGYTVTMNSMSASGMLSPARYPFTLIITEESSVSYAKCSRTTDKVVVFTVNQVSSMTPLAVSNETKYRMSWQF